MNFFFCKFKIHICRKNLVIYHFIVHTHESVLAVRVVCSMHCAALDRACPVLPFGCPGSGVTTV